MATQTIAQLFDLTGKGAIVTGGAMGIGKGIALRLAEAGASVIIADINLEAASQTAEQISAGGGKAQVMRSDAGSTTDAKNVVQATVEAFGRLDILVNNAGIYPFSPVLQISEEMWDKVHNTNLRSVLFHSQAAAQEMIRVGHGGKIINVASMNAFRPFGNTAHYDASKGGVVMLTKSLALELGPHNILVNAVAPGAIVTPGTDQAGVASAALAQASGMSAEELEAQGWSFIQRLPLRRRGEPDDIAKVVLFLASSAADYMTGSAVLVDGGFLLI